MASTMWLIVAVLAAADGTAFSCSPGCVGGCNPDLPQFCQGADKGACVPGFWWGFLLVLSSSHNSPTRGRTRIQPKTQGNATFAAGSTSPLGALLLLLHTPGVSILPGTPPAATSHAMRPTTATQAVAVTSTVIHRSHRRNPLPRQQLLPFSASAAAVSRASATASHPPA